MKITIITVCYNSDKTIENTFKSVATQTYKNIEYLVIDGNSKDNTVNIIKQYQHIITNWVSESDKGLYDAMNKGIQMATGDIIGILNSDDIFNDSYVLESVASFHRQNPTIVASVGNIVQTNNEGKIIRKYSAANWSPEKLKIGFMPPHPAIFFDKKLFDLFGNYKLDFKIGADYELITRFFLKNKISWKYSDITTTSMLAGGVSSSGLASYQLITKEIEKALCYNQIKFNRLTIILRGVWKLKGLLQRK